jgi:hypothetical protein
MFPDPPASSIIKCFSIYQNSGTSTNLPAGSQTIIKLNTVAFNDGNFDTGTYKYTTRQSGYYLITGRCDIQAGAGYQYCNIGIDSVPDTIRGGQNNAGVAGSNYGHFVLGWLYIASGSTIYMGAMAQAGGTTNGGSNTTFMQGLYLGP